MKRLLKLFHRCLWSSSSEEEAAVLLLMFISIHWPVYFMYEGIATGLTYITVCSNTDVSIKQVVIKLSSSSECTSSVLLVLLLWFVPCFSLSSLLEVPRLHSWFYIIYLVFLLFLLPFLMHPLRYNFRLISYDDILVSWLLHFSPGAFPALPLL